MQLLQAVYTFSADQPLLLTWAIISKEQLHLTSLKTGLRQTYGAQTLRLISEVSNGSTLAVHGV